MTDRIAAAPELIGDPPRLIRPTFALDAETVGAMLTDPSAASLLERLDITGDDAADLLPLLHRAAADEQILAAITETANALRSGAGLDAQRADLVAGREANQHLQQRIAPGEGVIEILALLVSTDVVRAWHEARGLSSDLSWRVLGDLGQQMRVHRRSSGRLGLHQLPWMALNWCGHLFHFGRLQFDLHRTDEGTEQERWILGTHIPARGPLSPAAVDDSFEQATAFFTQHFADLATDRPAGAPAFGREFTCDSWLINAQLPQFLGAESNIGAFVERWDIIKTFPGDDAAAFFVFGVRPPYDPASLPRSTTLEREVAERLTDGRGWSSGIGRLVR